MREESIQAAIALCRCKKTHDIYGVRFEKREASQWMYNWAFPVKESAAKREGYDLTKIIGDIFPDESYPGCPYCGAKYFVICDCGKLNCYQNTEVTRFTCEWCGTTGSISAYDGSGFQTGGDL